jgi:predicted nucleotidyltransferase
MPAIHNVVQQVAAHFQPEKVILFGSYAYGHSQPESDVDLLVIMRTPLKPMEQAVRICQAIEYHFGLDLIVRTPEMLERRLALGDPFLAEIVSEGKVLYERIDNRVPALGDDVNTPDVAGTAHLCYTHVSQKRLDFEFESDIGRWEAQNDA